MLKFITPKGLYHKCFCGSIENDVLEIIVKKLNILIKNLSFLQNKSNLLKIT
jgi:hypothetical protein